MKALSRPTLAALAATLALALLDSPGSGPLAGAQEGDRRSGEDPAPARQEGERAREDERPAPRPRPRPQESPRRPTDPVEYDVFGRRIGGEPRTFAERLLGGWQLVEMRLPGLPDQGREAQGFLHVSPGFLSMEIHAAWGGGAATEGDFLPEDFHESFTAEYQVLGGARLRCLTILGSYIDAEAGALMWEQAQYERQFRVREIAGRVVMEFDAETGQQGQLVWERRLPRLDAGVDIYGRPRSFDDLKGGQDVFGRDVEPGVGEPDIFGRRERRDPEEGSAGGAGGGETPPPAPEEPATGGGGRR